MKIATFNVSMEADNYRKTRTDPRQSNALKQRLANGEHRQIKNIAEIIQRTRPDIILLNEFDYIPDPNQGVEAFIRHYLQVGQRGAQPVDYPFYFVAPVNTGIASPFDIDGDGIASGTAGDAWGFGHYPGQYGMVLLSRFPIDYDKIRNFQNLKWHTMPNAQSILNVDGSDFYDATTWQGLRLSSKSHWDVPILIENNLVHVLAAHPTPPVFDGPEGRNGARNFDEIRLWADHISDDGAPYLIDDQGKQGGLPEGRRFVILGDYNASPDEGSSRPGAIQQLLQHPAVNGDFVPTSQGGAAHSPDNPYAATHTAQWRARVDYVLPSKRGFEILDGGVFWPHKHSPLHRLIAHRGASSDHRLVWLELALTD
ncbi:endonuclease/exonuclease/phosphatase family protein [Ferrimonas pelagia]|uniref:Endonuclease/exonuclease/phosphatase family protein n=1 Tax=Ferrimonas pelagia TaxID=1177826 RepID=A0ABP9ENT7_9GAMM